MEIRSKFSAPIAHRKRAHDQSAAGRHPCWALHSDRRARSSYLQEAGAGTASCSQPLQGWLPGTECTQHQAQCPSHAELGFVALWLAHMMLVIKGLSKKLWLLFPEDVTKEFSWCPTFCPAQESLSAQTLSWKGIHLTWELLNIYPIPTLCRNCSIWTVHYDPRKEMAGKENPGERDRKTIQGIWHSACICKVHRREAEPPWEAI